ncbi:MAG TPA: hypothetical protein VGD63_08560 [Steroidobacteraceae bacterium]
MSQLSLAPMGDGACDVKLDTDKGRSAQSVKDTAFFRKIACKSAADYRSNPGRVRAALGELFGEQSHQSPISVQPKNFKP